MFPSLDLNNVSTKIEEETTETSTNIKLGRCFLFNFKEKKHIVRDGKLVEATEIEATKQWVELLVRTILNKYKVYEGTGFGTTLDRIIGQKKLPAGFIESEIKREIEEKIVLHKKISGISDFTTERIRNGLNISFTVNLKNGNTVQSEVSMDV